MIETDDISHAAPSTISRTYLTYFNREDVDWKHLWHTWVAQMTDPLVTAWLTANADRSALLNCCLVS